MQVCHQFMRRSETVVVRTLGVAVLLAGCSRGSSGLISVAGADRITAGQYFSDFGSYLSPSQTQLLAIDVAPTGGVTLRVCDNNTRQVPSMSMELPSGPWFAVWNKADDMFLFVDGPANDDRVFKWSKDAQFGVHGTTIIGEFGGWEGVPEEFVAKLPDRWRTMYQTWRNKSMEDE